MKRFKLLSTKHPNLIINTLSNIFTTRLIGNKTHGDMAEIGMAEFIHQFMYDFDSRHVGKDLFRAKEHEEDVVIINEIEKREFPVSLKAYGDGPLQLSTDKESRMFPKLREYGTEIEDKRTIQGIFHSKEFEVLRTINVMPLIYREKDRKCNIMVFDFDKLETKTRRVLFVDKNCCYDFETKKVVAKHGRKHPVYLFLDGEDGYICEVRYGGTEANALQRGLWTHTVHASSFFNSLTDGWLSYNHNQALVKLFCLALNSSKQAHEEANILLQKDIDKLREVL